MYLFVFFWSSALVSARNVSGVTEDPPFGLIFACFMCSMMAGSVLFTTARSSHNIASASFILNAAITFASVSLLSAVIVPNHEYLVFWAFCLVELCVGMYFPSMNFLKSNIVEDDSRAKIYSFMRLPLSTLVVLAHALAEEGLSACCPKALEKMSVSDYESLGDHHRNNVFLSFGGVLLLAFIITHRYVQ